MKKIKITYYCLLLITSHITEITPQQPQVTWILSPSDSDNKNHADSNYVTPEPEFSYKAKEEQSFTTKIDTYLPSPQTNDNHQEPDSTTITRSALSSIVGTIPGTFELSPTGSVNYTIPIEKPPGVNGMEPNISLIYNSRTGNGIAGWGWDIGGLSMITRVPNSIYFDDKINPFDWSKNSPLILDGQRLIKTSESGSTIEYKTENEAYNKITGKNIKDWGPEIIEVQTKEGLLYEFGRVDDPGSYMLLRRVKISTNDSKYNLGWRLCKVSDKFGNFIQYNYNYLETIFTLPPPFPAIRYYFYRDHVLSSITYGTSLSEQESIIGKIDFTYKTRTDTIIGHIDGEYSRNIKLLEYITVSSHDNTYRKYELKYSLNSIGKNQLNEITCFNGDNEKFNPTTITWGSINQNVSVSNTPSSNFSDYTLYSTDVDGDGISELICMIQDNIDIVSYFKVFRPTINSNGDITAIERDINKNYWVASKNFDINSSPLNIKYRIGALFSSNIVNKTPLLWVPHIRTENNQKTKFTCVELNSNKGITFYLKSKTDDVPLFATSDFNNDGYDDILIIEQTKKTGKYPAYIFYGHLGWQTTNIYKEFDLELDGRPEGVYCFDFNNDGLKDILVASNETLGYKIFKNDGGNVFDENVLTIDFSEAANSTLFGCTYNTKPIPGDFNGDGLIDFIYNEPNTSTWFFAINNGNFEFNRHDLPAITAVEERVTTNNDNKDKCIVYDFNNDGKDDVIIIESVYSTFFFKNFYVAWYKSTGYNVAETKRITSTDINFTRNKYSTIGDFNGDGNIDLITYSSDFYNGNYDDAKFYFHRSFNSNFEAGTVKNITDALGNKTEFEYKPLTNTSIYSATTFNNLLTPVTRLKGAPLYVLTKSKTTSGGQQFEKTYTYENALIQTTGKGFLGFLSTKIKDLTLNIETENKLTFDTYFQVLLPNTITQKYNSSTVINVTTYNISLETISGKRYKTKLNSIKNEDKLKNTTITQSFSNYDNYGNPKTIVTDYGGGISDTQTLTYIQKGSWCDNKISTSKITKTNNLGSEVFETNYTWYDNGKINTETQNPGNTDFELKTTYENYDSFGNPKKITVSNKGKNRTKQMTYSPSGRFLLTLKDVELNETKSYTYNEVKAVLLTENDLLGSTIYDYDGFGRLKKITYPDQTNSVTSLQWADNNAPSETKYYIYKETSGQSPIKIWCDGLGREKRTDFYALNEKLTYITTKYNAKGQLYRISVPHTTTNPSLWETTYSYDNYGRLQTLTTQLGTTTYTYSGLKTTETSPQGTTETVTNAAGQITKSTVNNKYVEYAYYPSGLLKTATPQNGYPITFEYDKMGNRTKIIDPDAGTITSIHNGFGQLIEQKRKISTSTDVVTSYQYKTSGLLESVNVDGRITNYVYDSKNRIQTISITDTHSKTINYDANNRPFKITETIEGNKTFITETQYDTFGRVYKEIYPSGYYTIKNYDKYGYLKKITDDKGIVVWEAVSANDRGQLTQYKQGGRNTTWTYTTKGLPISIVSTGIINMAYVYNANGNLQNRADRISLQKENFVEYDANRLKKWNHYKQSVLTGIQTITYDDNTGGIKTKNFVQTQMSYGGTDKPVHALTKVNSSLVPSTQNISYTNFNKTSSITQDDQTLHLLYGVDNQRIKTTLKIYPFRLGVTLLTRYYHGNYEEEINSAGNSRKLHYITAGKTLAAIMVRNGNTDSLYYTYCDYQNNLLAVTDAGGNIKERYAYDPWGLRVNPNDWSQKDTRQSFLFTRGYTLHEHLDYLGLINMNGRMYDPSVAQFLSPDPYLQAPGNWYNYNRYAYGMNNPLIYTDPSGEWIHLVIGAIIGGYANWLTHDAEISWKGLGYFGVGALAGALGAGVGAGISSVMAGGGFGAGFIGSSAAMTASSSFVTGAAIGGGAGLASGFTTGLGNGLIGGQNFGQSLCSGAKSGFWGSLSGGLICGVFQGIQAEKDSRDFLTGERYEKIKFDVKNLGSLSENDCFPTTITEAYDYFGGDMSYIDAQRISSYKDEQGVKGTISDYENFLSNHFNKSKLSASYLSMDNVREIQSRGALISTYHNTGKIGRDGLKIWHSDIIRMIKYYESGKTIITIRNGSYSLSYANSWFFYLLRGLK